MYITTNLQDSIPITGTQGQKLLTHLHAIGRGENNWWCLPDHLVPHLLKHAEVTKAEGTLVVPQWVSAPSWPLLFPDGKKAATFIKQVVELPRQKDLFFPGLTGLNIFNGTPNTAVLALRLSFVEAAVATAAR